MKPKIKIKYGKLIDSFFKDSVNVSHLDFEFPTKEEVLKKVELFKKAWNDNGDKFIDFLYSQTGLEFKRNIIDCYIVSATPRDMSAPLIIKSRYDEKEFMAAICHELIHILYSDNKVKRDNRFRDQSTTIQNHIFLFALLKQYYLEVLNDEVGFRKIYEKSSAVKNTEYRKAWDIVDEIGFNDLFKKL